MGKGCGAEMPTTEMDPYEETDGGWGRGQAKSASLCARNRAPGWTVGGVDRGKPYCDEGIDADGVERGSKKGAGGAQL